LLKMLETYFSTARSVITSLSAIPGWSDLGHQLEHLALATRQLDERVVAAPLGQEFRDDDRVDRRAAVRARDHAELRR
jgi:hypothetical protein